MRLSHDVEVVVDETTNELSVLSNRPGVVGDELTLALVNGDGEIELRVKVADSRPDLTRGEMRHRVRLEVLSATSLPHSSNAGRFE